MCTFWISGLDHHEPQCNNLKWASFCFIAPNKWGIFFSSAWAVLTGLECLHVMLYRMCPRIAWVTQHTCSVFLFFVFSTLRQTMWRREHGHLWFSESGGGGGGRGVGGHLSYLNAELMIPLSGHGTRNPKQKMQAECCRVKTIRWFSFTGGY